MLSFVWIVLGLKNLVIFGILERGFHMTSEASKVAISTIEGTIYELLLGQLDGILVVLYGLSGLKSCDNSKGIRRSTCFFLILYWSDNSGIYITP